MRFAIDAASKADIVVSDGRSLLAKRGICFKSEISEIVVTRPIF
jgi:hypothetical protein